MGDSDKDRDAATSIHGPAAGGATGHPGPFAISLDMGDIRGGGATDDVGSDVRWMSYAELGQVRGISTASATRLAFRRKWRRQVGNDGTARVAVPIGEARRQHDRPHDGMADVTGGARADTARVVAALEGAVAALRERAAAADRQADQAEKGRGAAETRAERAEQAITEAQNRAERAESGRDQERSRADTLQNQVQEAQTRLATLEAEAKAAHDRAWASGEAQAAAERRAGAAQARADRAESAAAHERQDFLDTESRTRRELEAVRQRADAAEQAAEQARRQAQEAQDTAEELRQAEAERRGRGLLARLRAAWRGE